MKKIIICIISTLLLINLFLLFGCESGNPESYTEQEHIERITERIEDDYMTDEYTSFEVYPLYNQNEQLVFFMVEFEPEKFMFIKLQEELSGCDGAFTQAVGSNSMYRRTDGGWRKYIGEDDKGPVYETDENRQIVYYHKSPYKMANVLNERKYLLNTQEDSYVPAIKLQNSFLNLITNQEFSIEKENWQEEQKNKGMSINFIGKPSFNL